MISFLFVAQRERRCLITYLSLKANGVRPPPSPGLIHQPKYSPSKTQGEFAPEDPVYLSVNGVPGISVSQAADGVYEGLDGRDDGMSVFKSTSTLIRIQVGSTTSQASTCRYYFH